MTAEIYELYINHKPLPKGTRIEGIWSKQYKRLSDHTLEAANKLPNHMSDELPFWIVGWTDLHDRLLGPTEKEPGQ